MLSFFLPSGSIILYLRVGRYLGNSHQTNLERLLELQVRGTVCAFDVKVNCAFNVDCKMVHVQNLIKKRLILSIKRLRHLIPAQICL